MTRPAKQILFWTITVLGAIAMFGLIPWDIPPGLLLSLILLIAAGMWALPLRGSESQDQ